MTRRAVGEPAAILACVQDYLEDHDGGAWERFGNTAYTTRSEGGILHLIARETGHLFAGGDVRFDLGAAQAGPGQTELSMRAGPTGISPMYASSSSWATRGSARPCGIRTSRRRERDGWRSC